MSAKDSKLSKIVHREVIAKAEGSRNYQEREKLIRHIRKLKNEAMVALVTGLSLMFGFLREVLCAAYLGTTAVMDDFLIAYMPFDLIQPAARDISAEGIRLIGDRKEPGYPAAFGRFCSWCFGIGAFAAVSYFIIFRIFRTSFDIGNNDFEWLFIISAISLSIFLAMVHSAFSTHFVNKGNVLFQVSHNLWLNIGMIIMLFAGSGYNGALMLALGVAAGSLFLVIPEYVMLRKDNIRLSGSKIGIEPKTDMAIVFPILYIMLQSAGSKGQILVERTLGAGLPEGSVAALNYAFRIYSFPFTLLLSPIVLPMVPKLAEAYRARDFEKLMSVGRKAVSWSLLLIIPFVAGINLWGESFVALLLGRGAFTEESTRSVTELLMIYSLGTPGWILLSVYVRILWSIGKSGFTVVITWLGIVPYYIAGYFLTPCFGVKGLAASSAVYLNIVGLIFYFYLKYHVGNLGHAKSS